MSRTPINQNEPPGAELPDDALAEGMAEASSLANEGQWQHALDLLLRLEAKHPDDAMLLCMLGLAARETGARGMAYDFFRRSAAQDPDDPSLLATLGGALSDWDDPEAERVLRLAALTAPHLPAARLNYGIYLAREGMFEAAIRELEAARDLDLDDPAVRIELGIAYLLSDRTEEGVTELGEVLSRSPDDSWAQALFGLALVEAGSSEEAAEQLYAASIARPEDWEIQIASALAAAAEEWWDHAWEAVARADLAPGADHSLIREAEERLELGASAARAFLADDFVAPVLRERLLARA